MEKKQGRSLIPAERIERRILLIRSEKVLLDADLALLYGVLTKNLVKAVKRNRDRFPADFMFQLTPEEHRALRFQFGTSNEGRGGRRYLPYAFTEQGVAMLSSVLRSKRAVEVNIAIMRAFVRLRQLLSSNAHLARRLERVERWIKKRGPKIDAVYKVIQRLAAPPTETEKKERIGFRPSEK